MPHQQESPQESPLDGPEYGRAVPERGISRQRHREAGTVESIA
jgi:hypothetical protein